MKPIYYARHAAERAAYVQAYRAHLGDAITDVVYLLPRKFLAEVQALLPDAHLLCYEDITTSNAVFNLAHDRALLVLDRVARYKLITADTFVRLSRAASQYRYRLLVDSVPFTGGIEYLYSPLALVDRGILGYQHWYSYRENNWEMLPNGRTVRAHDLAVLADKLRPYVTVAPSAHFSATLETVACPLTREERGEYQALRDHLFATETRGAPIITKLADWTNLRASRFAALDALIAQHSGAVAIYTNLASHNRRLQKAFPGVTVKSFYDANGAEDQYDAVILAELPIVRGYLFLDVMAGVRPDCRVVCLRSDTTVDTLLWTRLATEYAHIGALLRQITCGDHS